SVSRLAEAGLSIVVGTTGWYEHLDEVRSWVRAKNVGLVYGSNFSIGANIVLRLVAETARLLKDFPEYDAYVLEHHHRGKTDTPSGTALSLASAILESGKRKERIEAGRLEAAIEPSALHVVGIRAGSAFGRHVVGFDGPADAIEISHTAKSREGFARGALFAAEWIRGKKGTFEFQELFEGRLT
ncbi:MAG: 4-hydroxy-tetrahydrodipicolinate reductase, partial [Vicinamibacteria bacterium]